MILIGGQALRQYGSDRHTDDIDYLINDESSDLTFIHNEEGDFINANGSGFFTQIYKMEKGNPIATPQALAELCAYSFVQHCQNFNFAKADAKEYDLKFLARKFNVTETPIAARYMTAGQYQEVKKILNEVRK